VGTTLFRFFIDTVLIVFKSVVTTDNECDHAAAVD